MPGFVAVLTGPTHVYEYVNEAYVTIAGQRSFLGRGVRDVFPDIEGQGFFELLDGVYETGEPFLASAIPIRLGGEDEDRFIDLLYHPIRNDDGVVTGSSSAATMSPSRTAQRSRCTNSTRHSNNG